MVTDKDIWEYLEEVSDPEIPVLSIVDLGVVRAIKLDDENCHVTITPTYSGCPAMKMIEVQIIEKLQEKGLKKVSVDLVLSPAWTTDWITEAGKQKLKEYGIAPPQYSTANNPHEKDAVVPCPRCNSIETTLISQFGSTACKALYKCDTCLEPFDYFKCH